MKSIKMTPIGYVDCPQLKTSADYGNRKKGEKFQAQLILNPELESALDDIESFDRLWIIFAFDKNLAKGFKTKVFPGPDPAHERGLFLTRSPYRPNPIGLSCVKLIGHEKNVLTFENSDILDGTPVLDIKPYIPDSDSWADARAGWLDKLK
jgi:tRNA-Thr(GGU) m(6)t(6)A37 methyltransferase TsaA